jgi:hypothetical protein
MEEKKCKETFTRAEVIHEVVLAFNAGIDHAEGINDISIQQYLYERFLMEEKPSGK